MIQKTTDTRQTMFDLALMGAGNIEAAFIEAYQNGISVTEPLSVDFEVNFEPENKIVVNFFSSEKHKPVSGDAIANGVFDESFDLTFE